MITALQCGRGWGMFWPKNDSITEGGPANGNGLPWILRKYSKNIISENVTKYSIFSVVHVRPNYQTYFSGEGALSGPPKVIKCNSWTALKAWIDLFSEVNEHLICVSRSFDLAIGCFSPCASLPPNWCLGRLAHCPTHFWPTGSKQGKFFSFIQVELSLVFACCHHYYCIYVGRPAPPFTIWNLCWCLPQLCLKLP